MAFTEKKKAHDVGVFGHVLDENVSRTINSSVKTSNQGLSGYEKTRDPKDLAVAAQRMHNTSGAGNGGFLSVGQMQMQSMNDLAARSIKLP